MEAFADEQPSLVLLVLGERLGQDSADARSSRDASALAAAGDALALYGLRQRV